MASRCWFIAVLWCGVVVAPTMSLRPWLHWSLPSHTAWLTVKRQAMNADQADPVGLYFGTTGGEVWGSRDEGRRFACLARHLPHIYSVETAVL